MSKKKEKINDQVLFLNKDGSIESVKYSYLKDKYEKNKPKILLIPVGNDDNKYIPIDKLCYDVKSFKARFNIGVSEQTCDPIETEYIYENVGSFVIECDRYIDIYRFCHSLMKIDGSYTNLFPIGRSGPTYIINKPSIEIVRTNNEKTSLEFSEEFSFREFIDLINDYLVGRKENLFKIVKRTIIIDTKEFRWNYSDIDVDDIDTIDAELYDDRYLISIKCTNFLSLSFIPAEDIMYFSFSSYFSLSFCGYVFTNEEEGEDFYFCLSKIIDDDSYEVYDIQKSSITSSVQEGISKLIYAEAFIDAYLFDKECLFGSMLDGYIFQADACIGASDKVFENEGDELNYVYICEDIDATRSKHESVYSRFMKRLKKIVDGKIPKYIHSREQLISNPSILDEIWKDVLIW